MTFISGRCQNHTKCHNGARWHSWLSKQMRLQPPLERVQWQAAVTQCWWQTVPHCVILAAFLRCTTMLQKDKLQPFDSQLPPESVFYKLGQHGLISFTDYVFLLVVLSSMSFTCATNSVNSSINNIAVARQVFDELVHCVESRFWSPACVTAAV